MQLRHFLYQEIDKAKWDACIAASPNRLIYGFSWWLDAMTNNQWNGIVINDYEAVMPLPFRKKMGIRYLFQPAFTQQGGVFYTNNEVGFSSILAFVKQHYSFAEIALNYGNSIAGDEHRLRNNYLLSLQFPYDVIASNYRHNFRKNLARASKQNFTIDTELNFSSLIHWYKELYGKRFLHITHSDYNNFEKACRIANNLNNLICKTCKLDNEIVAGVILLRDDNRLYNMVSCTSEKGRLHRANYFLYNEIFKQLANQNLLFDFEGSDNEGIANFYESANPALQPYPFIKINNLPFWIKWLKG